MPDTACAVAPRCALFAWDGTLVDTRALVTTALRSATSELLGYAFPTTPEDFRMVLPMPAREACEMLAEDPVLVRRLEVTYDRAHVRLRPGLIAVYPGAIETLAALRRSGIAVGVVSSKERSRLLDDADHCGIDVYVDVYITGEAEPERHPHPRPVDATLEALRCTPEEAVLIADGPHNLVAGRAAGVPTVGVLYGNFPEHEVRRARPTWTAHELAEVLELLVGPVGDRAL